MVSRDGWLLSLDVYYIGTLEYKYKMDDLIVKTAKVTLCSMF